jgi:hypothetical protein
LKYTNDERNNVTKQELEQKIRAILPGADIDTDNEGQFIIYTNTTEED